MPGCAATSPPELLRVAAGFLPTESQLNTQTRQTINWPNCTKNSIDSIKELNKLTLSGSTGPDGGAAGGSVRWLDQVTSSRVGHSSKQVRFSCCVQPSFNLSSQMFWKNKTKNNTCASWIKIYYLLCLFLFSCVSAQNHIHWNFFVLLRNRFYHWWNGSEGTERCSDNVLEECSPLCRKDIPGPNQLCFSTDLRTEWDTLYSLLD